MKKLFVEVGIQHPVIPFCFLNVYGVDHGGATAPFWASVTLKKPLVSSETSGIRVGARFSLQQDASLAKL